VSNVSMTILRDGKIFQLDKMSKRLVQWSHSKECRTFHSVPGVRMPCTKNLDVK
jgi:hypothetical protein